LGEVRVDDDDRLLLLVMMAGSSSLAKGLVCRVGGVSESSSKGFIVHLQISSCDSV
jgi:hypothetical protein